MPIEPPNGPNYYCNSCEYRFRQPFWRRLLGLRPPPFARCPKCGGIAAPLQY